MYAPVAAQKAGVKIRGVCADAERLSEVCASRPSEKVTSDPLRGGRCIGDATRRPAEVMCLVSRPGPCGLLLHAPPPINQLETKMLQALKSYQAESSAHAHDLLRDTSEHQSRVQSLCRDHGARVRHRAKWPPGRSISTGCTDPSIAGFAVHGLRLLSTSEPHCRPTITAPPDQGAKPTVAPRSMSLIRLQSIMQSRRLT